ncbi:unnamed protein product [Orchesella dallaii]|uniref:Uncharacterized protein n=1 Tax=Orchesella dallaii TaxID=48710 RepID=A0ABP1RS35_9HEXA
MTKPLKDSFSIVLSSTCCSDIFSNTTSDFSNEIHPSLDLEGFEVGLTHLTYHDDWRDKPTWEKRIIERKPKTGKSFFQNQSIDNEIIYSTTTVQGIRFRKEYKSIGNFTTDLNNLFISSSLDTEIVLNLPADSTKSITATLRYLADDGYQLHLPLDIAQLYGFENTSFDKGEYDAKEVVDVAILERIPDHKEWIIQRRKRNTSSVYLEQMQDPVLKTVLSNIILSSSLAGFEVSFDLDETRAIVEYEIEPADATLKLSNFLNKYLSLPEDEILSGSQSFSIPREIIDPFSEVYINRDEYIQLHTLEKVVVQSNAVEESVIYNSKKLNVLAVLDRPEGKGKRVWHSSKKLAYYPATTSILGYINIKLVDETGACIIPQEKPSCAILHFRKSLY